MMVVDPRESQFDVPQKATKAVVTKDQLGVAQFVQYDPSNIELEEGQVLVRLIYSGVCYSDLHLASGEKPFPPKLEAGLGLVGGHEGAGVVVRLGPGSDQWVHVGDRVGIKWAADVCLKCEYCCAGFESSCPDIKGSGFSVDGTFQQYAVTSAKYVTPIPAGLALSDAAPILCAGITMYRALKEAGLQPGQWVVLTGAGGGLGHLGVQYAVAMGFRVIAIDTGEDKKAMVQQLGADAWIDFQHTTGTQDLVTQIRALTNGFGAHAAIVTATNALAYSQAFEYIRPRGTLVTISAPPDCKLNLDILHITTTAKKIVGSSVGNRLDALDALRMAEAGKVKVVTHLRGLSELNDVFDDMRNGLISGRVVLDLDK